MRQCGQPRLLPGPSRETIPTSVVGWAMNYTGPGGVVKDTCRLNDGLWEPWKCESRRARARPFGSPGRSRRPRFPLASAAPPLTRIALGRLRRRLALRGRGRPAGELDDDRALPDLHVLHPLQHAVHVLRREVD